MSGILPPLPSEPSGRNTSKFEYTQINIRVPPNIQLHKYS